MRPCVTWLHPVSAHVLETRDVLISGLAQDAEGASVADSRGFESWLFPRGGQGGTETLLLGDWEVTSATGPAGCPAQCRRVAWRPLPRDGLASAESWALLQGTPASSVGFVPGWCAPPQPRFSWGTDKAGAGVDVPQMGNREEAPRSASLEVCTSAAWSSDSSAVSAAPRGTGSLGGVLSVSTHSPLVQASFEPLV